MSNFFGDIARSFGLIGDYFQQSAERGRQIVESKKPIQPTIQSTQPKVGDVSIGGFFGDIAQKFNLGVPELVTPKPIPEPTPVQKAISKMTTQEKWQATGQLSKDLALVFPRAVAQTTLEIVAMPKQILTGEVAKPIKVPTLLKPIFGEEMTTYALNTQRAIQSGVSPTGAVLLNGLFGAWDMAIVGSLLKFGSQAVLRDVKVPETSHYAAWETMGRPTTRAEAKQTYRGLAHTLHPDKPTGSTQAMTALNNAYKIIEKQGIPKAPPKPVQVIYDIAKTLNTPVSEIAKIPSAQPFLGVKGYLPGARPVPGQAPAFGLSVQEVERVGGKSITAKLNADIQNYKRMGVGGAGTIPINPSLVALEESSKLPEVQKITQNQVKSIPKNSDGTITVYRVGEITKPTGLVSVTYTKEAAQAFKDITFPEKIVSVTSMKIKPEDVKIFVGGAEKELLIQNPKIAQISPKIAPELETLAQEARTFESARLWKLSYEGIPADKANKIAQQLIDAGFVEKLPVGMVSKKVVPDFEGFYKIAIESIKPKMAIPKELTPLLQEARKFKSAEEFVKTKATLMRGAKTAEIRPGKVGVYLTSDRAMAETFAGKEGVITKAFADVKKTYKIPKADEYEWLDALIENPKDYSKYIAELKSKGYDSILSSDKRQLLVFDRNKVLTKSQLTDFYNQAVGVKEIKPEIPIMETIPGEVVEAVREEIRSNDLIDDILDGKLTMKIPSGDVKTDWRETLGRGQYMRIFRKEGAYEPDAVAMDHGMTEDELKNALVDRIQLRDSIYNEITRMEEEKGLGLEFTSAEINPEEIFKGASAIIKEEVSQTLGQVFKTVEGGERISMPPTIDTRTETEKVAFIKGYLRKLKNDLEVEGGLENPMIVRDMNEIGGYNFASVEELKSVLMAVKKTPAEVKRTIALENQATATQAINAHLIAARKHLSDMQYKRLARIFTGQSTVDAMTKQEADSFINAMEGLTIGFGGRPRISQSRALLPPEAIPEITAGMKDVGIGSKFLSPRLVFKHIGNVAYDNVFEPIMQGVENFRSNVSKIKDELVDKQKSIGVRRFTRRLFPKKYQAQSERLFNSLNEGVDAGLTPKEKEVSVWAKNLFDKYADRLDVLLAKQGLPPINRRTKYITNLINEELKYAIREGQRIDSSFFAILDEITPKQVFDPFLLAREGKLPIQKDFWKALNAYIGISERKLAFDEVLPQIQAYIKQLPAEAQRYAKWFVRNTMGKPSEIDRLIKNTLQNWSDKILGKKTIKIQIELDTGLREMEFEIPRLRIPVKIGAVVIGKLKKYNYLSFIGANIRTGSINLSQPVSTAANLPRGLFKNLIDMSYGYGKVITKIFSPKAWREMREKDILTETEKMLEEEFSMSGILGDLTMWNMKISEFINRVSSTYAGKRGFAKFLEKRGIKLADEEALALGRELSDLMNFRYGLGETPKIFRNPVGQLYYQYNTFATKQAELIANMAARTFKKGQVEEFMKAVNDGKGVEYLKKQGSPTRVALLRYILYVSALIAATSTLGVSIADVFYKGAVPNQVENLIRGVYALVTGNWYEAMKDIGMAATPPIVSGLAPSKLVPFPKGFIPAEKQIFRIKKGKSLKQVLGFERISTKKPPAVGGLKFNFGKQKMPGISPLKFNFK